MCMFRIFPIVLRPVSFCSSVKRFYPLHYPTTCNHVKFMFLCVFFFSVMSGDDSKSLNDIYQGYINSSASEFILFFFFNIIKSIESKVFFLRIRIKIKRILIALYSRRTQ